MNKNTIAIALVAAAVSAQGHGNDPDFREWIAQHNKNFSDASEMNKRERNFNASKVRVENLRRRYPQTQWALNIFADLDEDEWEAMRGMDESTLGDRRLQATKTGSGRQLQTAAPSVNWLTSGHMGPVKNQRQCGSCWAFNSTSVLEAKKSIKDTAANGGVLVAPQRLSEQEAVDCSTSYGNGGCNGGWPSNYWQYALENGAVRNSDYEYTALDEVCKQDGSIAIETTVENWNWVSQNDQVIANALQSGPLSIAVMVEGLGWRDYAGGVMPTDGCVTASVNHALVLVAYESGLGETIPGEDVWVPGTDPVWVPGTEDEWVPATEDYCRASKRRERRRNRCNGGVAILSVDETECCIPGEEGYWIPGEAGYFTEGTEGYWEQGEDTVVQESDPVWVFQNSWGPNWGDNGMIRIPVQVGNGPGHCQVQRYVQSVTAL